MSTAVAVPVRPIPADLKVTGLAMKGEAANTVAEAMAGRPSTMEIKYDGWRLMAHVREDGVRIYSPRNGADVTGRCPAIEAELADRFPAGTWLDGEGVGLKVQHGLVVNDWGLAQSVLTTTSRAHPRRDEMTFIAFDLISHGGIDARPLAFRERRALLEAIFDGQDWTRVQLATQMEPTEENYEALLKLGFEGAMVKHLDAPYRSGKGRIVRKLKGTHTVEVVVTGFTESEAGTGLIGAIEFAQNDADGNLVARGRCSGMKMAQREEMTFNPERWIGTVIEVKHNGAMPPNAEYPLGALRHPNFKRARPDRTPESVEIHDR